MSRSQLGFYPYALRTVTDRAEPSFALLRYFLGGNRPSQTDPHALSQIQVMDLVRLLTSKEWCFTFWLRQDRNPGFNASHLR